MARYSNMSSIKTKLKIAGIFLAILVIFTLQYSWYSNSIQSSIESTHKAISSTVHQTITREYRRFDNLLMELTRPGRHRVESEGSLRLFLERIMSSYGPEPSDMPLLKFAGYLSLSTADGAFLYRGSGGPRRWEEDRTLGDVPDEVASRLDDGDCIVHSRGTDVPEDILMLHAKGPAGETYRLLIGLDIEGFFSAFVKPAIASSLAEYSIEWGLSSPPPPPDPELFDNRASYADYRFNPLRGLLRIGRDIAESRFLIYVPRIPLGLMEKDRDRPPPPSWEPPQSMGDYRSIWTLPAGPRKNSAGSFRTARIKMQGLPMEQAIEQRKSVAWLGGTALLIGVGISFCFLVLQQERLARLRAKEREFIASVTHEFRTPLTVILSAAENIRTGIVPAEKLVQYGTLISEQTIRLDRMIEEALAIASMEANPQRKTEQTGIETRELMVSLRVTMDPLATQAGIKLVWDFDSLPGSFRSDRKSMELILNNFIANAVYHAYPGPQKGDIRVYGAATSNGELTFAVEDDGRGIAPRDSKHVFEPFYRDPFSREHQEKGSGLGLFLAKRKALSLGGSIRLESPYRRSDGSMKHGCRFTLRLPYASEVAHEL